MPTGDIILLILLLGLVLGGLIVVFRKESRYLRRRVSETMSDAVRQELEVERNAALSRRLKFEEALKKFQDPGST